MSEPLFDSADAEMFLEGLRETIAERDQLRARVERLEQALHEISAAIYNDNGDVTTSLDYVGIKRAARAALKEGK